MKYDSYSIKHLADCRDICRSVGLEMTVKGFVCCPFHAEKTGSCKVWRDRFHCFGCGVHGDAIDLTKQLYQTDFNGACAILSDMYGIAPIQSGTAQADAFRRKLAEQNRMRREREKRIELLRNNYFRLVAEYRRLENNRAKYAPRSEKDPLSPLFTEALRSLDAVEDDMRRAEWAWHDAERINTI